MIIFLKAVLYTYKLNDLAKSKVAVTANLATVHVTRHEGLMYTKYTYSYYSMYKSFISTKLSYSTSYDC